MTPKRYHYTVRMMSWTHSPEDFHKLREWARENCKGFWWNYVDGGFAAFAFWAYPSEVNDILEQQGWYAHALSIDVGKGAIPEEEH